MLGISARMDLLADLYTKAYCVPLPCTAVPVLSLVVGYVLHAEIKL